MQGSSLDSHPFPRHFSNDSFARRHIDSVEATELSFSDPSFEQLVNFLVFENGRC